jgi:hypothetical protein
MLLRRAVKTHPIVRCPTNAKRERAPVTPCKRRADVGPASRAGQTLRLSDAVAPGATAGSARRPYPAHAGDRFGPLKQFWNTP